MRFLLLLVSFFSLINFANAQEYLEGVIAETNDFVAVDIKVLGNDPQPYPSDPKCTYINKYVDAKIKVNSVEYRVTDILWRYCKDEEKPVSLWIVSETTAISATQAEMVGLELHQIKNTRYYNGVLYRNVKRPHYSFPGSDKSFKVVLKESLK